MPYPHASIYRDDPEAWAVIRKERGRAGIPQCEGFHGPCDSIDVRSIPAMTAYHWDGEGEDPNRDRILCKECAEGYVEHWSDMWEDYWAGRL
jgi:hypothetical protein